MPQSIDKLRFVNAQEENCGNLKICGFSGRLPDRKNDFFRKRKRLFPKNASLPYMPPNLMENGEVSQPLHTSPGFVNYLMVSTLMVLVLPVMPLIWPPVTTTLSPFSRFRVSRATRTA